MVVAGGDLGTRERSLWYWVGGQAVENICRADGVVEDAVRGGIFTTVQIVVWFENHALGVTVNCMLRRYYFVLPIEDLTGGWLCVPIPHGSPLFPN